MKKLLICAALAAACNSAFAGGYVGIGAPGGVVWHDQAAVDSSGEKQELAYAAKIFVGYSFDKTWSAEAGYLLLDSMSRLIPGVGTVDINADAVFADLVGTIPLSEKIGLFGRIGLAWTTLESDATSTGQPASANARVHETGPRLGAGAQYDFSNGVSMRAEWERTFKFGSNESGNLAVSEFDVDVFNITAMYRF